MLTQQEKLKIKDILGDGLGINRQINFPYFLTAIDETNNEVKSLRHQIDYINQRQNEIERKLDYLINLIAGKSRF